jgi:hypothetical protein
MHGNVNVNKNGNIFGISCTFYICLFDVRPPEYVPKKIETCRSISGMYMKVIFFVSFYSVRFDMSQNFLIFSHRYFVCTARLAHAYDMPHASDHVEITK